MAKTANALTLVLAIGAALVLVRAAPAAYPTPVNDQITDSIAGIDSNENGTVDAAEWRVAGDRTFAALDSDKDGNISREEYALIHGATFPAMDTNHDGEVSIAEADTYRRLPWTLGLFR
jgi:hypothetical protein